MNTPVIVDLHNVSLSVIIKILENYSWGSAKICIKLSRSNILFSKHIYESNLDFICP